MLRTKRLAACVLLAIVLVSTLAQPAAAIALTPTYRDEFLKVPLVIVQPQPETPAVQAISMVHKSASQSSLVIGNLENGTVIKVLGSSGKFYKIDCYDVTGYINKAQVAQNASGEYYVNCNPDHADTKYITTVSAAAALELRNLIRTTSKKYIGVPYVYGAASPKGFDCSGFTMYVFKQTGYALHRSANAQLQDGIIIAKEDLQCGDLIFFTRTTHSGNYASHVGIYIGNGQMIHAGSKGIAVVRFSDSYYQNHYLCARRIIINDAAIEFQIPTTGITQDINSSFWRENTQTETNGLGSFFSPGLA